MASSSSSTSTRKFVKEHGHLGVLTGRRKRQETMLSIRKAKKEDAYATRRNFKANVPLASGDSDTPLQDVDSRTQLLENIANRSQTLLHGVQHKDPSTRQKSMRAFVYLLSSGVPPLFDETHSQHLGLWQTILAAVPSFVDILNEDIRDSNSVQMHSDAAFALRFISSMEKAFLVVQAGAVPKLVQLFQCGVTELQVQAAWCLGNIASESAECCEAILTNCPPLLVFPHIRMATPSLRRAAVWLLRSLVEFPEVMEKCGAFSEQMKQEMLEVLTSIIAHLANEKAKALVDANDQPTGTASTVKHSGLSSWRIFEVNTGKEPPNDVAVVRFVREMDETKVEVVDVDVNFETGESVVFVVNKSDMRPMQAIEDVGEEDDDEEEADVLDEKVLTLCDSCWSLVELSVYDIDMVSPIVASGLCSKLVALLHLSPSGVVLAPVLRLVGSIVSADVSYTQAMIDAHLLETIPKLLSNTNRSVREEACWILSNIAGDPDQVKSLVQRPPVLSGLMEQMAWAEYAVKREATWALCNIVTNSEVATVLALVHMGVLQYFAPMLDDVQDAALELVILQAIASLLAKLPNDGKIFVEENDCLSKIEDLCYDANEDVSQTAAHIMDTWFSSEDGEDTDSSMQPAVIPADATNGEGASALSFQPVQSDVKFDFQEATH